MATGKMAVTNLPEQLARDEGKKSSAYPDSRGYWSIGIGTCIDARVGCGLTDDEIQYLFDNRVKQAEAALSSAFPWTDALDEVRRGALLNLTFNMGVRRLSGFTRFLAAAQQGDWTAAKAELLDSAADHQEPERISRLAEQLVSGTWQ
jgi:lysozyme